MKTTQKKITKATFKSFIHKNRERLCIMVESKFDGMHDCVTSVKDIPTPIKTTDTCLENTLGINGVWLVGGSRNFFYYYEDSLFKGIHVSNCCGSFTIGVIK